MPAEPFTSEKPNLGRESWFKRLKRDLIVILGRLRPFVIMITILVCALEYWAGLGGKGFAFIILLQLYLLFTMELEK